MIDAATINAATCNAANLQCGQPVPSLPRTLPQPVPWGQS